MQQLSEHHIKQTGSYEDKRGWYQNFYYNLDQLLAGNKEIIDQCEYIPETFQYRGKFPDWRYDKNVLTFEDLPDSEG